MSEKLYEHALDIRTKSINIESMHTRDSQVNQPLEVIADTSMIKTFKNTVKNKKIKVSKWKTTKKERC